MAVQQLAPGGRAHPRAREGGRCPSIASSAKQDEDSDGRGRKEPKATGVPPGATADRGGDVNRLTT